MQRFLLVNLIVLNIVYLHGKSFAFPQTDEDYASYATLYPEIAKKIGEEPIEIIDVVKAVLVYDSDDTTPNPGQTPPPDAPPTEGNSTVELF